MELVQQFQQFRQKMAGTNPKDVIDQLVQSGQMSVQQRDSLFQQAQSFMSMFRR